MHKQETFILSQLNSRNTPTENVPVYNRVLIFIVAYNANEHIRSVFDRLPTQIFNHPNFHILVIDDCSQDKTAKTASTHIHQYHYQNVTILRNALNQGYGGNQKLGYRYAIENGFDVVVLLHGDGQYAPELVLEFVKKFQVECATRTLGEGKRASSTDESAKPDVVLGSRMLNKAEARKGGMPFYKWIGNQVLTWMQNAILDTQLSEFHTGYRAYSTKFLKQVPFELNTNDFHFDTEILLQAFALKSNVIEFPIPTHYGKEICHVNGTQYAWNVLKACIKYRCQQIGFFCSMQYRGLLNLKNTARFSNQIKNYLQKRIEQNKKSLSLSIENIETPHDASSYNYLLILDVLENISNPERALINLRYAMTKQTQPTFIFSVGNVAFVFLRILLAFGIFNYGEQGILRVDNLRLFTLSSFRRMLRETGYRVKKVIGVGLPFELLFPNRLGRLLTHCSNFFARLFPSLFAFRFIVEATPEPHSFMLLSTAEKFYEVPKQDQSANP